jgi:hypothetical protein
MPRAIWPLRRGRPIVQVFLTVAPSGHDLQRILMADTGGGPIRAGFDLLLKMSDFTECDGFPAQSVILGGAYTGEHPISILRVRIPVLGFDKNLPVVGVPNTPDGFNGIACFQFLSRFTYGNFGDPNQFGLET